jgi:ATP phosphoribosyltransferase regulatory subunit
MTRPTAPLLPQGLRDRLPAEAAAASQVTRALVDAMRGHGYTRVAPPIAEYRETFASDGEGATAAGRNLLRFTDPVSQRTLAIRPDITRQIGRIVTSRLAAAPRPLRLAYAGQVVRLTASALWPERELLQVGAELVGSDSVAAVCEIVGVAIDALHAAGVSAITVDLTLPDLVDTLAASALPLAPAHIDAVKAELDAKDAGGLEALGAAAYLPLIAASGPFARAIARLRAIDAGGALASRIAALETIAAHIGDRATVTLDPTERHGFEYQSWFGFSIFVAGHAVTVGRGGSYSIDHGGGQAERAVGFSLFPDPLIAAGLGHEVDAGQRLFLPLGHDVAAAAALRAAGWITVAALDAADDGALLGCSHWLDAATPHAY